MPLTFPRKSSVVASLAILWLSGPFSATAQCVMCGEALSSGGSRELITGFLISTVLMITVPVVLVSTFIYLLYRASCEQQAETGEPTSVDPPSSPAASSTSS